MAKIDNNLDKKLLGNVIYTPFKKHHSVMSRVGMKQLWRVINKYQSGPDIIIPILSCVAIVSRLKLKRG